MKNTRTKNNQKNEKNVQNGDKNTKIEKLFSPEHLREAMNTNGLNVESLAKSVYKSPRSIYHYLEGKRMPSESDLMMLSKVLNVSPTYLRGLTDYPDKDELAAVVKEENDKMMAIYETTFRMLNDLGVSWSVEGDNLYIDTDTHKHIYVDYPMFWFMLDGIRNHAKHIFDDYCASGVYVNGSKGLVDIKPGLFEMWDTTDDSE